MAKRNFRVLALFIASAVVAVTIGNTTALTQSRWATSGFPGEEAKSVIGCSVTHTDEAWLCLAVRCEPEGRLGLYLEITGLGPEGPLDILIDRHRYTVSAPLASSDVAYSNRIEGPVEEIIAHLSNGTSATIVHPTVNSRENFNRIPLRGSKAVIERLERSCAPAAGSGSAIASSMGVEYRDGKIIGVHGLSERADCAFATARATFDEFEMDQGAIGGVWFVENGERFHANLDREQTSDAGTKQQLMDFFSQEGATFDIGLHGCGAAGRISHLVYVKLSDE